MKSILFWCSILIIGAIVIWIVAMSLVSLILFWITGLPLTHDFYYNPLFILGTTFVGVGAIRASTFLTNWLISKYG